MTSAVRWLGGAAAALVVVLILSAVVMGAERDKGRAEATAAVMAKAASVAKAAAADSGRLFRAARLRAESAEARFVHAGGSETAAISHTDTARVRLEAERDRALALAKDSAATAAELRAELSRFVSRSDSVVAAASLERDTLTHRIALAVTAIGEKDAAIVAAAGTIRSDSVALHAVEQELADLKRAQPGFVARALHGAATFAVGAGCAGVAYASLVTPAGPVVAVVAAATGGGVCAAVWGIARK